MKHKALQYAYPTSDVADDAGFKNGCWFTSIRLDDGTEVSRQGFHEKPLAAFELWAAEPLPVYVPACKACQIFANTFAPNHKENER